MKTHFHTHIHQRMTAKNTRLCVGLDPRLELIPELYLKQAEQDFGQTLEAVGQAITQFHRDVIDQVAPFAVCVKPQSAFFEQYGVPGLMALQDVIGYAQAADLPVILDAKRGDIDSTALAYATASIGKTQVFGKAQSMLGADAVTINPYLGTETLLPFLAVAREQGAGLFVLLKTSNPGSAEIQDAVVKSSGSQESSVSKQLAERLLRLTDAKDLDEFGYSPLGVVVGATYPELAREFRQLLPHSLFLVPGIGAQGGDVSQLSAFFDTNELGAVINSSRGVVSVANPKDSDALKKIAVAAQNTRDQINAAL